MGKMKNKEQEWSRDRIIWSAVSNGRILFDDNGSVAQPQLS